MAQESELGNNFNLIGREDGCHHASLTYKSFSSCLKFSLIIGVFFQSFSSSGLVILLNWVQTVDTNTHLTEYTNNNSYCDFNKERGKVSILNKSSKVLYKSIFFWCLKLCWLVWRLNFVCFVYLEINNQCQFVHANCYVMYCMRWMKMSLEMYNMLCMIWLKSFLKLPDPYLCIISEVLLQRNVYCCLDWSIFNYFFISTVCGLHFTFWLMVNSTKARNITRNKFSYVCEVDWTIKN